MSELIQREVPDDAPLRSQSGEEPNDGAISVERYVLEGARDALRKIRDCSIAGCHEGYGKPELWAQALFESHGDATRAIVRLETALSVVDPPAPVSSRESVIGESADRATRKTGDHPEWLWYGEDTSGKMHITFGRWNKHACQVRYVQALVQPTEHDPGTYEVSTQDRPSAVPMVQTYCSTCQKLLSVEPEPTDPAPSTDREAIARACFEVENDTTDTPWETADANHRHTYYNYADAILALRPTHAGRAAIVEADVRVAFEKVTRERCERDGGWESVPSFARSETGGMYALRHVQAAYTEFLRGWIAALSGEG